MALNRIIYFVISGAAFLLQGIKLALFLIGSSTVIEDAQLLPGKVGAVMDFIAAQPAFAFYGFFTCLGLLCLWLAFRPAYSKASPSSSNEGSTTISSHHQSGGVTAHTVNMGGDDVRK